MRNKIALRNVNTVEKLLNAQSIVFDKTGTLTKGRLKIADIELYDKKYTEDEILRICSLCEGNICHPVARSLKVHDFYSKPLASEPIYLPSKGIIANYHGQKVVIGNRQLMKDQKISLDKTINRNSMDKGVYLPVYVAIDQNICAKISLIEELEETSIESISSIKELGVTDISIISGDLKNNTSHIAERLNLDHYYGNLSPSAKEKYVNDKKTTGSVIMVGDGINDTAALKAADVSITFINNSCEQAILKSDCILEEKDMLLIPRLMNLTEKSYYRIQRNIDFSQSYNYVMGFLAMFGYIGPFKAKGLNTMNSILAMINSMRILNIKTNEKLLMRGENNQ